jgi:hypothetical protein
MKCQRVFFLLLFWRSVYHKRKGIAIGSRVIDVPGADRFIRRVDFFYRSLGAAGGRATVELWGK